MYKIISLLKKLPSLELDAEDARIFETLSNKLRTKTKENFQQCLEAEAQKEPLKYEKFVNKRQMLKDLYKYFDNWEPVVQALLDWPRLLDEYKQALISKPIIADELLPLTIAFLAKTKINYDINHVYNALQIITFMESANNIAYVATNYLAALDYRKKNASKPIDENIEILFSQLEKEFEAKDKIDELIPVWKHHKEYICKLFINKLKMTAPDIYKHFTDSSFENDQRDIIERFHSGLPANVAKARASKEVRELEEAYLIISDILYTLVAEKCDDQIRLPAHKLETFNNKLKTHQDFLSPWLDKKNRLGKIMSLSKQPGTISISRYYTRKKTPAFFGQPRTAEMGILIESMTFHSKPGSSY